MVAPRDVIGDAQIVGYLVWTQFDNVAVGKITAVRLLNCACPRWKTSDTIAGFNGVGGGKIENALGSEIIRFRGCWRRGCFRGDD